MRPFIATLVVLALSSCSKRAHPREDAAAIESNSATSVDRMDASVGPSFERPAYADLASFDETEIVVNPGEWALPGTLSMPETPARVPAVVIVHGSGPTDRDGTYGAQKRYRDIAWGLASRGIAVVRHDKRTLVHAAKLDATLTVNDESVDDALAAARLLRASPRVDPARIYIAGHSLGGTLTPRILARDPSLAGGVILAGAASPLEDILADQQIRLVSRSPVSDVKPSAAVRELIAEATADAKRQRDQVKTLSAADAGKFRPRIFGASPSYWLDLRDYKPAVVAAALATPLLLLEAGKDQQVPASDFALWKQALAARTNVTFRSYPTLNHLFIVDHGGGMREYGRRPEHVHADVIDDMAAWIGRSPARPAP